MSELNSCTYCHTNNATNVVCSIVDDQYYSQEACGIFLKGVVMGTKRNSQWQSCTE